MNIQLWLAIALLPSWALKAEKPPLVIAHRGASADAPENTIPAFELAWQMGADGIEGDFHLTGDGKIVCIHDGNTRKSAGRDLVVSKSTLAELQALDVGALQGKEFEGTGIPTFEQVASTVPKGKLIYVEVKCGVEIIPTLLAAIGRSGLADDQIVLISFKKDVIARIKAEAPRFRACWLCHFKREDSGTTAPSLESVLKTLADVNADGLSASADMPETYVRPLRENGYEWHVWTVNDPQMARRMSALGTDSVTTDVPGLIREHLAR